MRVRSLASLSGLRTWCCHKLWHKLQMWLGSGVAVTVEEASVAVLTLPLAWVWPLKEKKVFPFQQAAVTNVVKQEISAKVIITDLVGGWARNSNLRSSNSFFVRSADLLPTDSPAPADTWSGLRLCFSKGLNLSLLSPSQGNWQDLILS